MTSMCAAADRPSGTFRRYMPHCAVACCQWWSNCPIEHVESFHSLIELPDSHSCCCAYIGGTLSQRILQVLADLYNLVIKADSPASLMYKNARLAPAPGWSSIHIKNMYIHGSVRRGQRTRRPCSRSAQLVGNHPKHIHACMHAAVLCTSYSVASVWLAVASPSIRVLAICHNPPSAHAATLTACALQHHDKNI